MTREWLREDGVLCLSGYPIRIHATPNGPLAFNLVSDFHGRALPYGTLESAKIDADRLAKEIDEFTPCGNIPMTDALDLDALEAAERAASLAPWRHEPMYPMMIGHRNVVHTNGAHPVHFGVSEHKNGSFEDAALTVALRNAAPALIALARRVQQDSAREGTHAPDCHLWGRRHYDCLLSKYEAAARERDALLEEVWALNEAAGYSREWGVRMDAETAIHRNRQLEEGLALQNAAAAILQPPEDLEGKDFYPWVEEQASRIKSDRAELARMREALEAVPP